MELHECNLQPPSDKTCPRLFVNRLRHPTGAPLTPLALALLRRRLENIRSKELIFLRFPFIFGFTPGGRSHLPTSRRQGPPGSLLCPPDRPFISPTPPLGGCSSGGGPHAAYLPQRRLSPPFCPQTHSSKRQKSHSSRTPRHDTARLGPLHLHQPSLLSHFQHAALTPALSFQKCGPKKKKKNSTHHIFYFEASADVKVFATSTFHISPSLFPAPFFLFSHFFPSWFSYSAPPPTSITPLLPNLLRACAVHSGRQRGIADRAAVEEHVLINLNQG